MLPLIIGGAKVLGAGAAALGVGSQLVRPFKDELGFGVIDAAREELNQNRYQGYNAGAGGTINRGTFETLRDWAMGNNPEEIRQAAQDLHVEGVRADLGGRVSRTNQALTDVGAPDRHLTITPSTTRQALKEELDNLDSRIPTIAEAQDANPDAGVTIDTPIPTATRATRAGRNEETNQNYLNSPQYQQYLDQLKASDKRFNATQQLAISCASNGSTESSQSTGDCSNEQSATNAS